MSNKSPPTEIDIRRRRHFRRMRMHANFVDELAMMEEDPSMPPLIEADLLRKMIRELEQAIAGRTMAARDARGTLEALDLSWALGIAARL